MQFLGRAVDASMKLHSYRYSHREVSFRRHYPRLATIRQWLHTLLESKRRGGRGDDDEPEAEWGDTASTGDSDAAGWTTAKGRMSGKRDSVTIPPKIRGTVCPMRKSSGLFATISKWHDPGSCTSNPRVRCHRDPDLTHAVKRGMTRPMPPPPHLRARGHLLIAEGLGPRGRPTLARPPIRGYPYGVGARDPQGYRASFPPRPFLPVFFYDRSS